MRISALLAAVLGVLAALPATAQETYPTRPIRFVVPFAAGGPSDIVARIIAPRMAATLGQPVVVDNRAGAGGATGVDVVARAAADGYVFGIGSAGALAISPSLGRGTPYDPIRDLAPITLAVLVPEPLVVPAASPFRSLQDLIADARARPGALNFGSTGSGSMPHLAAEQLRAAAGIDIVHVSYNSGGQLATAILRNEMQLGFADLPVLLSNIQAGTMRALAVGTRERLSWLPDVPTFGELGLPAVDASNWHGLVAPARMAAGPLGALRRAAIAALQDPEVRQRLHEQGAIPGGNSPEEFAAFIRSENQKWGEIIRRNHIAAD
ncbi:Bug family tripartite tricarboxylate transporter substrate binding protein [Plastoroseomonas hellenica]|uniref:Bug family tripartite tricarboxylate transporter substrate binding protein n=1 Tax=Plastoroseomonas hellenica TaxID=2687306 RepID=UPI001BA72070|nr:tripartite tricarboxylate transporter substrate binding protein [Plastoroseomonas hellenica]MBR0645013.1 tripartite tricarboxylate transporter substrate binding protein [Plastoroseomonas hellenica]